MRMIYAIAALVPLFVVTACATTATAEEVAHCQRMAANMGTTSTHDHAQMKGMPAESMNLSHERCQRILRSHRAD